MPLTADRTAVSSFEFAKDSTTGCELRGTGSRLLVTEVADGASPASPQSAIDQPGRTRAAAALFQLMSLLLVAFGPFRELREQDAEDEGKTRYGFAQSN